MPSSTPLAGKVALITGSSKGIGRATALQLSALGAKVVINYSSSAKDADAVVQQIGPDNAIAIKADVSSIPDLEALVNKTVERFGKIDILIPNAGILPNKDLENTSEEDFDKCFGVNVKGVYFLVQKAVPHMSPSSRIILLSSSLTSLSGITPNYLLYVATKGAIEQMTRVLAKDLGRKGITVNAVAPGPTATDMFMAGKPEQLIKTLASFNPFNRLGDPEDIAGVMGFLASEQSSWVSGQVVKANGAMT
jgi:3-oxoacyl-[acyl-carrier protein] reductase